MLWFLSGSGVCIVVDGGGREGVMTWCGGGCWGGGFAVGEAW